MRIIAAYFLAVLGGNDQPDKASITKILSSVGITAEDDRIEALLKAVEGKNLDELLEEGKAKLGSMAPAAGSAPASASSGAAAPKAEAKKEESEKEESEADMGFSLFD